MELSDAHLLEALKLLPAAEQRSFDVCLAAEIETVQDRMRLAAVAAAEAALEAASEATLQAAPKIALKATSKAASEAASRAALEVASEAALKAASKAALEAASEAARGLPEAAGSHPEQHRSSPDAVV